MGMYTEMYVSVDLKKSVDARVIQVLQAMVEKDYIFMEQEGLPSRWSYMFNSGSYYTSNTSTSKLFYDGLSKQYSLIGKGDIKNYSGEIEEFFEWVTTHVEGGDDERAEFLGFMRYEEEEAPVLVFKKNGKTVFDVPPSKVDL